MFQFLTVFAQRRLEYGSDVHNLLKRYHASLEDENSKSDVDDDDLLKWAEIFGKIDANANSYIDKEEFESYVQYNYSSPLKTKKDCKEVLTVAMERFTAAVMDHPQDKDFGGLEFKHFVKMMQALQKDAENGGETVHKFYDFLTKVKAKKQREEDSTSAKIIEGAAGRVFVFNFSTCFGLACFNRHTVLRMAKRHYSKLWKVFEIIRHRSN